MIVGAEFLIHLKGVQIHQDLPESLVVGLRGELEALDFLAEVREWLAQFCLTHSYDGVALLVSCDKVLVLLRVRFYGLGDVERRKHLFVEQEDHHHGQRHQIILPTRRHILQLVERHEIQVGHATLLLLLPQVLLWISGREVWRGLGTIQERHGLITKIHFLRPQF